MTHRHYPELEQHVKDRLARFKNRLNAEESTQAFLSEITRRPWRSLSKHPPEPGEASESRDPTEPCLRELSAREDELMGYLAEGLDNSQIGVVMVIALETVKSHKKRVFSALGAVNAAHAVALWYDRRIVAAFEVTDAG